MRSAGDGLAGLGDWCDCVHLQAKPHGQIDMFSNDQAADSAGQQLGPALHRTRRRAELAARRSNLLEPQELDTVSTNVGHGPARDDKTRHCNTRATGSQGTGHRKHKASSGRVSRTSMTGSRSVSEHTDPGSPPGHGLTTNNNNSCVGGPALLPTCPTTDNDRMLLGPDQIDMLLALAISNCSGNEMVGCCKIALQSSHVGNILRNYLVAVKYGLSDVMDRMINVIRRNFLCVSRTREFLSLPLEYILIFMDDSYLNIQNELDMFVTCLMWIDYNKQERIAHSGRVLKCVRYAYIDPGDIVQYVEPNLHLFTGQEGAEALVNLYKHHVFTQSGQPLPGYSSMILPRRGMHGVPAQAHIVSGAPRMPATTGARKQSAASRTRLGAMPTGHVPDKTSGKGQKGRVSFAADTAIPSKDTPPASGTQRGKAATTPSGEKTPVATAANTAAVGGAPVANGASTAAVGGAPVANGASAAAVGKRPLAKAASTPSFGAEPLMKGASGTTGVGGATLAKAASSPGLVRDKQTLQPVTTPALVGAQPETAGSTPAASEKPPENVQDKSNNSRLCGDLCGRWVCADPSVLAMQVREHQRSSSFHPGINGRHNWTCPGRASNLCPTAVSGCQDHFMAPDVADSECGRLVRSQPTFHVCRPTPSGLIDERSAWVEAEAARQMRRSMECVQDQKSSHVEAEAARIMRRSLEGVSGQKQPQPGQDLHPHHVFVITRSLSGPVVSIAYPHSDPAPDW